MHMLHEAVDGPYVLSTDQQRIDIDAVHGFLSESSSWARGIPRSTVEEAIRNSLCFGLYQDGTLLAFCRVVTDGATFGNLVDVFVQPDLRGRDLSKKLMAFVMSHPLIPRLRRLTLATADAHGLYEQFGFRPLGKPETFMEVYRPDIYRAP